MSNKNDRWSALSMKERADLMNMYITNGISDLKEMKKHYNSFGNGSRILSGEENTEKKPIFDPQKIIDNVPAREFGPQKVMGKNDYLAMPGTNSILAPIQYFADKGTGKQNIEFAQQVISDFENIEDKQNHIKENSDYYKTYLDAIAYLNHVEALKKYLKLPYDTNTIKESNYKPTRLQGTDTKTYKFSSEENPEHWTPVINSMLINNYDEHQYIDPTLNTFTAYRDRDDRGDFVSIYDEWDYNLTTKGGPKILNKPIEMVTGGKPFVIYDRVYLDDYYNVPEGFKGNPYIAPAYVTAYTEKTKNKLRNMGVSEKELEKFKYGGNILKNMPDLFK